MALLQIQKQIRAHASAERAAISRRFFKTGKGEYAEGDQFCGVRVPELRKIAREHIDLSLKDVIVLLHSPIHEDRFVALCILVRQYEVGDEKKQSSIVRLYLSSIDAYINNWDLVDTSAEHIIGKHVAHTKDRAFLERLAHSESVWERRVAIVATFFMIKKYDHKNTLYIANILLHDSHDLIHKATGWMLREVGKHNGEKVLRTFLNTHAAYMPRTMLRYAIERYSASERRYFLNKRS